MVPVHVMNGSSLSQSFPPIPDLKQELAHLLLQIPAGQITSFGTLAIQLGDRTAARWVALQLKEWAQSDVANAARRPWHRVLMKSGQLPDRGGGLRERQLQLLCQEHVTFTEDGLCLASQFERFESTFPLRELARWQEQAAARIAAECTTTSRPIRTIAGVDVSYRTSEHAIAAYVEIDPDTGESLFETTLAARLSFPYIPGYLAFRELPSLRQILAHVRDRRPLADVILVDGTGQLHPRRLGIATSLGLIEQCPTIGVAKHRLCGQVRPFEACREGDAVWLNDVWTGTGLPRPGRASRATSRLWVSPGYMIGVAETTHLVSRLLQLGEKRLPTFQADRLSRHVARQHSSTGTRP